MHTEGLQNKEDELQRLIIRLQPLILTHEANGQTIFLTVECNLQRDYPVHRVRLVHKGGVDRIDLSVKRGASWDKIRSQRPDGTADDIVLTEFSFPEQTAQHLKLDVYTQTGSETLTLSEIEIWSP